MPSPARTTRRAARTALVLAVTAAVAVTVPPAQAAPGTAPATAAMAAAPTAAAGHGLARKPFMGWSSWSMQTSSYPGLNPTGQYSYLTEANVLKQADAMATKLKKYGYEYINIDAGWWRDQDWTPEFDGYGRQQADPVRFPRGMKPVADDLHSKGLKAGIYLPVGLEKEGYGGGRLPVWNAPGCTTGDIVYGDLRTTNGWDSSYKIDFSRPCAQKYVDSQAQLIADWGYDFLKLDGVGPGSFKSGDNYDNRADVAAWKKAIERAGRPVHLEISWSLDVDYADSWKENSDGWRVDTDVECYCETLVTWDSSVKARWRDTPAWTRHAGPGGWNDLDAIDVGNGEMDGLTKAERQSYMTLWSIAKSPLYSGDDLTRLDAYGVSLLTNREVLRVNQRPGAPAHPVTTAGDEQVWAARNPDGSYTVALFNLGSSPAPVTARWSALGFEGKAAVRDLWNKENLGQHKDSITEALPAHGSRLFTVTPHGSRLRTTAYEAESPANTLSGNASVSDCDECSGGKKVGNLYEGGSVRFGHVEAARAGTYYINVAYTSGDERSVGISANGKPATKRIFPSSGGWGAAATISVPVTLKAGRNTLTFDSGASGYSPDIDRIDVPKRS
ncbi:MULTISPECIES: alpha-galactosidase D [unclassified Streptomyces]|uniref:alpha-galactosidase D n=1 Tax=unclassified Streptomyces TaxID=2593676 RepID=UPI0037F8F0BF